MELETVADIKLATRAINNSWPITDKMRATLVRRAYDRARCGDPEIEDKASKFLLAVDKANQQKQQAEQRRLEQEHARKLQLIELAVKLGIVANDNAGTGSVDSIASAVAE